MSFRLKLLLAMMLVVGAITTATLLAMQSKVQSAYQQIFEDQFQNQIAFFNRLQEERLANVKERSLNFVRSVRVIAAFNEYLNEKTREREKDLYANLRNILFRPDQARGGPGQRPEQEPQPGGGPGGPGGPGARGPGGQPGFQIILNEKGEVIQRDDGPRQRRGGRHDLDIQVSPLANAMKGKEQQQFGYLAPALESPNPRLHEVILTKIIDPDDDRVLGALVLGIPVSDFSEKALSRMSQIQSGIFLDGEIYSTFKSIPETTRPQIVAGLQKAIQGGKVFETQFPLVINGLPYTVFVKSLNLGSAFPRAYQVCVYSLDEPVRVQRDIRAQILLFGGLAMLGALAFSLVLSHGLSMPMNELVRATREVEKGNFEVRVPVQSKDEIGVLAQSFNQMTEGLALKEKYRSVLDLVADKRIAHDLINGKIALGGEERDVSVLFCDIRGFTAVTQNMSPPEVIQMLNEHFTPLTRVVYEHHGVVDKFVGDLIMAIFGAPTSRGNDPVLAAQCALRMIEERMKLNENSAHKLTIGIGIASGKAVAGRMGSDDRLQYTVLGPRVNLASRLCSSAGRMEIVVDDVTCAACRNLATVEPLPEMKLKGFSTPVHAYKLTSLRTE